MTVKLDFEECLKDSPRFRAAIEMVEGNVSELETRLEKLVKQCNSMLEAGKVYCQSSKSFVNGLRELGHYCSEDSTMGVSAFAITSYSFTELIEATQKSVKLKLQGFVKDDVKHFKDVRKEFERNSETLEAALGRNAQAPRGKQHEVEEASQALLTARRAFRSGALDYVLEVHACMHSYIPHMLSLMEAQALFFQQGHQSLTELEEYRKHLGDEHTKLVLNSAREKRDMEQRHAAIKKKDMSYDDSVMDFNLDAPTGIAMEGYLYKRASNAFKTWSRRWFSIQKNQLVYQKKFKEQPTVVVEDLRLCTVKPCTEQERRFCFEVVSPAKSCLLQADSEQQQQGWMSAVQNSIASAFQERREDRCSSVSGIMNIGGGEQQNSGCKALEEVQAIPGNGHCCDCREPGPDWASINLGITLCITCSGIHRSLGVHFSKVRSLTLDSWEPELVKLMCELGNTAINRIYEARIEEITIKKPHPSNVMQRPKPNYYSLPACFPADEEEEDLSGLHPGALLYRSATLQHFPVMADALAHGADVNWVNVAEDNKTPLIQANSLAACEFLLQNGANVNQADSDGRGPLHHATILGHTGLVCLFLKRGADYNAKDINEKDPITIAVESANADIVTLLRIAKMNKEMREMDGFAQSGHSEGLGCAGGSGYGDLIGQTKKSFQAFRNHLRH
uniref:Arf-GAP with coiled-coil, ANK repeat and PH domain-containing protein n=1 Tax=Electrophorus electricus TaxID=8005 RepID=A0A4W4DS14_ELEEL